MLRVTIELIPNGQIDEKETLYHIDITNDGAGTKKMGKYKYQVIEHDNIGAGYTHYIPILEGYDVKHRRAGSVFKLIFNVLKHLFKSKGIT